MIAFYASWRYFFLEQLFVKLVIVSHSYRYIVFPHNLLRFNRYRIIRHFNLNVIILKKKKNDVNALIRLDLYLRIYDFRSATELPEFV